MGAAGGAVEQVVGVALLAVCRTRFVTAVGLRLLRSRSLGCGPGLCHAVAMVQVPSVRVRPRASRRRRFNAAVRFWSQAWFFATPR